MQGMPTPADFGPPVLASDLQLHEHVLDRAAAHIGAASRSSPDVSGWSVGQQLLHLCRAAASMGMLIRRLARSGGADEPTRQDARDLLARAVIPRGVAEAPPPLVPTPSPSEEEIREALEKARATWATVAADEAAVQGARGTFAHPLIGPLTAAEWVRFAAVHGAHHLAIVDDILADDA